MKKILILILITISLSGFSQNSKWSVGFHGSFDVGFRFFTDVGSCDQFIVDYRNEFDVPAIMYTAGFFGEYRFKKFGSLNIGAHYSTYGDYAKDRVGFGFLPDGTPFGEIRRNDINRFHHIGIPIHANFYPLTKDKVDFFIGVGTDLDFTMMMARNSTIHFNNELFSDEYITEEVGKPQFTSRVFVPKVYLSLGVDLKFGHSILRLEPNFRMNMIRQFDDTGFGSYYYKGGLNIAYIYNF